MIRSGAFIFGSYARREQTKDSDFDVIVVVNEDNSCKEINKNKKKEISEINCDCEVCREDLKLFN